MARFERIVVVGVSGAGKSRVGSALALRLGLPFIDADDLHPPANVARMTAGIPLTDEDRGPWLDTVGAALAAAPGGAVVACSALRRRYRDRIRAAVPGAFFVELSGTPELLRDRLAARAGHFMPPALLDSQFAALEPLEADEAGAVVRVDAAPADVLERALAALAGAFGSYPQAT